MVANRVSTVSSSNSSSNVVLRALDLLDGLWGITGVLDTTSAYDLRVQPSATGEYGVVSKFKLWSKSLLTGEFWFKTVSEQVETKPVIECKLVVLVWEIGKRLLGGKRVGCFSRWLINEPGLVLVE